MSDTKLLQAISDRIASMDRKIDNGFKEMKEEFKKTNARIDNLGKEIVELVVGV